MIRPIGRGNGCGGRYWILRHGLITSDVPFRDTPSRFSASACAFTTIKKSEPPTPCFAQPDWDSVFCAGRRLQFCTPALFDCGAPFRGAYDNASTGLCAAPVRDLLRRYARCYPLMKALDLIRLIVSLFPCGWRLALWPSQMLLLLGAHY